MVNRPWGTSTYESIFDFFGTLSSKWKYDSFVRCVNRVDEILKTAGADVRSSSANSMNVVVQQ